MILNNQKQAVNLRIQYSLALLIFVIAIGLIYFTDIFKQGVLSYNKDQVAIFILVVFILYFLLNFLRNPQYIYYSDTGNKFILRYFSLRPIAGKKNSIEFNKGELKKFEIKQSLLGFNQNIIIYRSTPKGIAKYPPVSITALGKDNRERMLASIQKLILANRNRK